MTFGVRFCGGCNPRFDRGAAFEEIKKETENLGDFKVVEEGVEYDTLLIIGGCTNCCASFEQFSVKSKDNIFKMWEQAQIPQIISNLKKCN